MRIAATLLTVLLLASGCAWVKLEPEARQVRVARAGEDLSHCQRAGDISVSVRDRVGLYQRDDLKVRDELETLARNEAGALRADTLQPLGPPLQGEQRFAGFRCDALAEAAPGAARQAAPHTAPQGTTAPRSGGFEPVETFPLEDDER